MSCALIGVLEATDDLNIALDECLLLWDDQLRTEIRSIHAEVETQVKQEKAQLVQEPEPDLVSRTLSLALTLGSIGDRLEAEEKDLEQRLSGVQSNVESRLEELDLFSNAIKQLSTARDLVGVLEKPGQLEARLVALNELARIHVRTNPNSRFSRWLKREVDRRSRTIKDETENQVVKLLKSLRWPGPPDLANPTTSTVARLVSSWISLEVLQGGDNLEVVKDEVTGELWAMGLLTKPCTIRFQYHFTSRDKATNRVDRPEWLVAFVLDTLRNTSPFIGSVLQTAFSSREECSHVMIDLLAHFIRVLVKCVDQRLSSTFDIIKQDKALLCHTMDELLAGDRVLAGEFGYVHTSHFPILSSFFLNEETRTKAWMTADLEFAQKRMKDILSSKTAWHSVRTAFKSIKVHGQSTIEFATECSDAAITLIDSLGSRIDLLAVEQIETRTSFCETVQVRLLTDFAIQCVQRPDIAERLNSLQPLKESLLDWRLKPRYTVVPKSRKANEKKRGMFLFKHTTREEGSQEDWVFHSTLVYVQKLIAEEIERELNLTFYSISENLKEFEKKSFAFGEVEVDETPAEDLQVSGELLRARVSISQVLDKWGNSINPVSRAQLVSGLASHLESWLLQMLGNKSFTASGILQFGYDLRLLAGLFATSIQTNNKKLESKLFPKLVARVEFLQQSLAELKQASLQDATEELTAKEIASLVKLRVQTTSV